jgi:hypothetical protein
MTDYRGPNALTQNPRLSDRTLTPTA